MSGRNRSTSKAKTLYVDLDGNTDKSKKINKMADKEINKTNL